MPELICVRLEEDWRPNRPLTIGDDISDPKQKPLKWVADAVRGMFSKPMNNSPRVMPRALQILAKAQTDAADLHSCPIWLEKSERRLVPQWLPEDARWFSFSGALP